MEHRSVLQMDPVSKPTPIYVLGDSHVLGFKNLFCRDSFTGGDYYTIVRYISGLAGGTFFSNGALGADILAALEYEGIIRDVQAAHLRTDPMDLAEAFASGVPQVAPLILVFCGDIDLRGNFLQYLKDEYDLILPFENPYPATDKPVLPYDMCLPLVQSRLEPLILGLNLLHNLGLVRTYLHRVAPPTLNADLFRQIHGFDCPVSTRYKAAALYNYCLTQQCQQHGVPILDIWPEVTADGYLRPEYELDGVHLAREANLISLRAMVEHALNNTPVIRNVERYRLLYEMATGKTGHVFDVSTGVNSYVSLPTAEAVETSHPAQPPQEPPPAAPVATVRSRRQRIRSLLGRGRRFLRHLLQGSEPSSAANHPAAAATESTSLPVLSAPEEPVIAAVAAPAACLPCPEPGADDPFARAAFLFRRDGVCILDLGWERALQWREMLDFRVDLVNRHARLDWAGNGLNPYNSYIRTAVPPVELLDGLRACFGADPFTDFFRACFDCLVTLINCRPFMSYPHADKGVGPQSWHHDGCPPGLFRALLYLTDVDLDSGPFEYIDSQAKRHAVTGPAGTLLVFDANRLLHRGSPPKKTERKVLDFVIAPRLADQPFRVLWPGLNNWPADPFQYSVNGMLASPPLPGAEVSFKPRRVA